MAAPGRAMPLLRHFLTCGRRRPSRSLAALNQEEGSMGCPFCTSFQIHLGALLGFSTLISEESDVTSSRTRARSIRADEKIRRGGARR